MTKQDLEDIYYLKLDVKRIEEKIEFARAKYESASGFSNSVSGSCKGSNKSKQEKYVDETEKYISKYYALKKELEERIHQAEEFIDTVSDPRMRLILEYRCIECLNWSKIAARLSGNNTTDSVRKAYSRFINDLPKK